MLANSNFNKLKTNLRLAINRLKLLQKKKTELAQKSRKEIADFIAAQKEDRARIRVEQIIREDYTVEVLELLEMYCDLLLARFGLITQMKTIDRGIEEAINTLIWAAPRLQCEIQEFKVISDQLTVKYGKPYAEACRANKLEKVNPKVMNKLSVLTPPKVLVEKYMVEIAKNYNVPFLPDPSVVLPDEVANAEAMLIDMKAREGEFGYYNNEKRDPSGNEVDIFATFSPTEPSAPSAPPGIGPPPMYPDVEYKSLPQPFNYPPPQQPKQPTVPQEPTYNEIPDLPDPPGNFSFAPNDDDDFGDFGNLPNQQGGSGSTDTGENPSGKNPQNLNNENNKTNPRGNKNVNKNSPPADDEIDFDDLTRRFEELKKKR